MNLLVNAFCPAHYPSSWEPFGRNRPGDGTGPGIKGNQALITWLIYAVYLHLYRNREWRGNNARWMVIIGFLLVMFTFFESIICFLDCTAMLEEKLCCCDYALIEQ